MTKLNDAGERTSDSMFVVLESFIEGVGKIQRRKQPEKKNVIQGKGLCNLRQNAECKNDKHDF